MIVLTLRTDKPIAEIGLYENNDQVAYETWQAHRQLAETIHVKIYDMLKKVGKDWENIDGIVAYKGPGSFTGLRIGLSVANALSYSLNVPIVAEHNNWVEQGIERLISGNTDHIVLPEYGSAVHITAPRK